jgi:type II secretory pathway component GspD/PulD (secretin)
MRRSIIMTKAVALIALALAPLSGFAQANSIIPGQEGNVSVASRGNDVRYVIHDLFAQCKKNYVLDPSIRFTLYLQLNDVEFEEALMIVCKTADLQYDVQNGIFYISKKPKPLAKPDLKINEAKPTGSQHKSGPDPKVEAKPAQPRGTLPATVLAKRVNTRFDKIDLRELMAALGKQAGVTIEVDPKVPAFKLDAYLINTSLKYALDQITEAAGLRYRFTDRLSISIHPGVEVKEEPKSKVTLRSDH